MKLLDTTYKLFTPEEAERKVKELAENDPDWTYRIVHDPTGQGYSFIEIFDEDGEFVSRL